jgi:sugar lactone lactonase YvrE
LPAAGVEAGRATGALELILDARCQLGESPVWSARENCLLFVDITGRRLLKFDPAAKTLKACEIEEDIGCVAPEVGGGFVAGLRSGMWILDEQGRKQRLLAANPEDSKVSRFNDGRVDPLGRFLAGTVDEAQAGRAGLYRYDKFGLIRLAAGLLTSNGLAFSPDGRTLYHSDTPRFVVNRYDYDSATGAATNRRVFVQLDPTAEDRGRPDGAAVDIEGCYWTALYDGGRVQRYDPTGKLMSEHPLPVRCPTMPAFGDPELKTLFVTTARDSSGLGGGLYATQLDVAGLPTPLFDPTL